MKMRLGKIPENDDVLSGRDGWIAMREPSPWISQLLAVPICVFITLGLISRWSRVNAEWYSGSLLAFVPYIVGVVAIHEMIHAAVLPGCGVTSKTTLGFWPAKFVFYAHYDDALSRSRFVVILLSPFIILSVVPLAIAQFMGNASFLPAFVSVLNGMLSCVDVLGALLVCMMVPKGARLRNSGWKTYYRTAEQTSAGDGAIRATPEQ